MTQATVSRDLDQLGAIKIRRGGETSYALPDDLAPTSTPETRLRALFGEWVRAVVPAASLVVLKTPPGSAHLVGVALDSADLSGRSVAAVNLDYRFPIAWPQRGLGTWPLFLRTVHGAVFVELEAPDATPIRWDAVAPGVRLCVASPREPQDNGHSRLVRCPEPESYLPAPGGFSLGALPSGRLKFPSSFLQACSGFSV